MKEKTLISPEQRRSGFFRKVKVLFSEERRAFVVLAAFMVILTVAAGGFTIVQDHILEHKFCQLVDASIQNPVPKPANPKANPSRETNYEDYVIVLNLDRSLGCNGGRPIT